MAWHSLVMQSSTAIEAARHFLSVVWDGPVPTDAVLTAALDRLIAAYHDAPDVGPTNYDVDPPRESDLAFFRQVGARFPAYGLYSLADPIDDPHTAMGMGDAIDDIGDITLDMRDVIWLADNIGPDDAHWSFRLQFFHWGTHARDLVRYLHGRQFG